MLMNCILMLIFVACVHSHIPLLSLYLSLKVRLLTSSIIKQYQLKHYAAKIDYIITHTNTCFSFRQTYFFFILKNIPKNYHAS